MQPTLIVTYLNWTVLSFVVVLLAGMMWLKLETRRFAKIRHAVSRRIGFEHETETFFTMDTKSQLATHAPCYRPIDHPSPGPRSKAERPQDKPEQRLPMPVDVFVRDLNDLLREQGGS